MAVLPGIMQQDDEENNQGQILSGEQAQVGAAPMAAGASGYTPTKSRAGGFVGIGQYLNAQGGAGENLAGQLGERLSTEGQGIRNEAIAQSGEFTEKAGPARTSLAGQIKEDPSKVQASAVGQNIAAYGGPRSLYDISGYGATKEKARGLESTLGSLGTSAGQESALQKYYASPAYSGGQKRLDVSLLGATPGVSERFKGIQSVLQPGLSEITGGGLEQNAANLAQSRASFAGEEQQAITKAIADKQASLSSILSSQAAQENEANKTKFQGIINALTDPRNTPQAREAASQELTAAGVDPSIILRAGVQPNFDWGKYLTQGSVTAEQTATPDQIAQYNALAGLAGGLGMPGQTNLSTASKGPLFTADLAGIKSALPAVVAKQSADVLPTDWSINTAATTPAEPPPVVQPELPPESQAAYGKAAEQARGAFGNIGGKGRTKDTPLSPDPFPVVRDVGDIIAGVGKQAIKDRPKVVEEVHKAEDTIKSAFGIKKKKKK